MAFVLALIASVLYGTADFLGGMASRRGNVIAVTALTQFVGVAVLVIAACFVPGSPSAAALTWGAIAGAFGTVGVVLLYAALAGGTVSTTAPLISMIAIVVPVVAGVIAGESLGLAPWAGILLGMLAVGLISRGDGSTSDTPAADARRAMVIAVLSGLTIGGFLVSVGRIPSGGGLWPLVVARGTGTVIMTLVALVRRVSWRVERGAIGAIVACGVADQSANVLYLFAAQRGALSLVATLVSLAPASTVLLAQLVLHERLSRAQQAGVALALIAVALLAQAG